MRRKRTAVYLAAILAFGLALTSVSCRKAEKPADSTAETALTSEAGDGTSVSDGADPAGDGSDPDGNSDGTGSAENSEEAGGSEDPAGTDPAGTDPSEAADSQAEADPAETVPEETVPEETYPVLEIGAPILGDAAVETDCKSYCVIDDEGNVWLSKNADLQLKPASTTKVLTALVVCEYLAESGHSMDEVVTVSEHAATAVDKLSSGVYPCLRAGEQFTVRDLLYMLELPSTNTAGNVLAEFVAGSTEAFAGMMNQKCRELGLVNSHFMNAHGLDEEGHYSAAFDLAVILKAAVQYPELTEILGTLNYTVPATEYVGERTVKNTHQILNGTMPCAGAYAGKPGWTYGAQGTLVTAFERDGRRFYIAVMCSDDYLHYRDTANLAETVYAAANGTAAVLSAEVRNMYVVEASDADFTVSWRLTNSPVSCRLVYWNEAVGTAGAQFVDGLPPAEVMTYTLPVSSQGIYMVQIFAVGQDGQEVVQAFHVLYQGSELPAADGITVWNGGHYFSNARGILETGFVELTSNCFYGGADGRLRAGCFTDDGEYYIDDDYEVACGWRTIGGQEYYFQADGLKTTGRILIGGVEYEFDADGVRIR